MSNLMFVDALELAMRGRELSGSVLTKDLLRLCQGLPEPQNARFTWGIVGRHDADQGQYWIDIKAQGQVQVVCQRCMQPFGLDLQVSNTVGLLASQAQLQAMDQLEAQGAGSDIDYLLAERKLNVLELLEDELILALPYAPRHETCPQGSKIEGLGSGSQSPFAVLKDLRKN